MAVAVLALGACDGRPDGHATTAPSGILLVTVGEWRHDAGSPGSAGSSLPAVWLGRGTSYENVLSVSPMTLPSATTVLSGVAPDRSGVHGDLEDLVPSTLALLPEGLASRGWTTAAFVGTPKLRRFSGIERGFDLYDVPDSDETGPARYEPAGREDPEVARRFAEWLGGVPAGSRWFAWVHLSGLEGVAIASEDAEAAREGYAVALETTRTALEGVFSAFESPAREEIRAAVIVGTHGVQLGEDGARGASFWLSEETLHVPLLVAAPGVERGGVDLRRAWLPDVASTLAGWADVALDPAAEGRTLVGEPGPLDAQRVRRAWTWAPDDQMAWPPWTAVDTPEGLQARSWSETEGDDRDSRLARPRDRSLPGDLRERIEADGVLRGWRPIEPQDRTAAERNEALFAVQYARHLIGERGHPRPARLKTKADFDAYPDALGAAFNRLYFVVLRGGEQRADWFGRIALRRFPLHGEVMHWFGHALALDGETERADLYWEAAMTLLPADWDLLYDRACSRALLGDREGALEFLDRAIAGGFRNWDHIERDPDLTTLRSDPRYVDLMRRHGR